MKTRFLWRVLLILIVGTCEIYAQKEDIRIDRIMDEPLSASGMKLDSVIDPNLKTWVSEQSLDSIDQEKIPHIVTMGILLSGNVSNFLITTGHGSSMKTTSSFLRVGVELGGFMDFIVTRHFAIQARLVFTAEQNHLAITDSTNHLWSFGADIPVLFMYRMGNLQKGYWSFGGGIFAHFTFASNVGIYKNVEYIPSAPSASEKPFNIALHDNHAGLMAHANYEFPFGMQMGVSYLISMSDIFGYYKNSKGTQWNDAAFYPQRISFGVAYRWK